MPAKHISQHKYHPACPKDYGQVIHMRCAPHVALGHGQSDHHLGCVHTTHPCRYLHWFHSLQGDQKYLQHSSGAFCSIWLQKEDNMKLYDNNSIQQTSFVLVTLSGNPLSREEAIPFYRD